MKRAFVYTLVLTALFLFTSCGKTGVTSPSAALSTPASPPLLTAQPPTSTPELKPATFVVSDLKISPVEVTSGTPVNIDVIVTNTGEMSGSFDVNLKVDGIIEATQKLTLAGGASQKVSFIATKTIVKSYSVAVAALTGQFTVKAPQTTAPPPTTTEAPKSFTLTSSAFNNDSAIPPKYSCDGQDVSPALSWANAPAGTKAFALICDDPDAPGGIWVHWVIFNIPSTVTTLQEGVQKQAQLADGSLQGRNDFGDTGYGGPCPPPGSLHHYEFKLYALDQVLPLQAGATKAQLVNAMSGHILAEVKLVGTFRH